jgi:hypothetical protein
MNRKKRRRRGPKVKEEERLMAACCAQVLVNIFNTTVSTPQGITTNLAIEQL